MAAARAGHTGGPRRAHAARRWKRPNSTAIRVFLVPVGLPLSHEPADANRGNAATYVHVPRTPL